MDKIILNNIIEFINRRFPIDCNWTDGNCFYFSLILSTRFSQLQIYHLPIEGHFCAGDGKNFYDYNGLIELQEEPELFSNIKEYDINYYQSLIRDCIL